MQRATRFEALEPIRQGVRRAFRRLRQGNVARGLAVRHDHGSQYMSDHFQKELAFLGIESSPAFVRAPEGNGCAERFIRTLKENLLWVRTFDTDRGTASGAARVPRDLQHDLADRAARLHLTQRHSGRSSFNPRRSRRVGFNPVSQQPRAVQTQCNVRRVYGGGRACRWASSSTAAAL